MRRRVSAFVLAVTGAAVALVVAAPLLRAIGFDGPADALFATFGHVCHQDAERSLHLFGHPLAVCGRCTGLYLGLLAALALGRVWRSEWRWVPVAALAVAPIAIAADVGFGALGLHESTWVTRLVSGFALGAGLAMVLGHARASVGLQLGALVLIAVPLLACKARDKPVKKDAPPPKVAPKPPPPPVTAAGCVRDTDCKGNRVCVNSECVDREVPVIVEVPTGCTRDVDCKGNRVCVDGECREPATAVPSTTVVEVVPSTTCDDCPGKCLAIKQKCNNGSVKDCFLAGACMCECKLAAGGCGSTPEELRSCISTNRAKAKR